MLKNERKTWEADVSSVSPLFPTFIFNMQVHKINNLNFIECALHEN